MFKKQIYDFTAQALLALMVTLSLSIPAFASDNWTEKPILIQNDTPVFVDADKMEEASSPESATTKRVGKHVKLNSAHPHLEFVHMKGDQYVVVIQPEFGTASKPSLFEQDENYRVDTFEFPYGKSKVLIYKPGKSALPECVSQFSVTALNPGHKLRRILKPLGIPATALIYGAFGAPNYFAIWIRSSIKAAKQGDWD